MKTRRSTIGVHSGALARARERLAAEIYSFQLREEPDESTKLRQLRQARQHVRKTMREYADRIIALVGSQQAILLVCTLGLVLTFYACGRGPVTVSPPSVSSRPVASTWAPLPGAQKWRKVILNEWRYAFGIASDEAVPFAQIHQESAWKEDARSRVGALGLSQFMPSTAAGFQRNVSRLQEICSVPSGCPLEPRWAIRAMVAYDHGEWTWASFAATEDDQWSITLVSYNGGRGWVIKERRACAERRGCDSTRWREHVARVCVRADWACAESRGYPDRILNVHRPRYRAWLSG